MGIWHDEGMCFLGASRVNVDVSDPSFPDAHESAAAKPPRANSRALQHTFVREVARDDVNGIYRSGCQSDGPGVLTANRPLGGLEQRVPSFTSSIVTWARATPSGREQCD